MLGRYLHWQRIGDSMFRLSCSDDASAFQRQPMRRWMLWGWARIRCARRTHANMVALDAGALLDCR